MVFSVMTIKYSESYISLQYLYHDTKIVKKISKSPYARKSLTYQPYISFSYREVLLSSPHVIIG